MSFKNREIDELIQYLQGSCETLDDGIRAVLGDEYSEDDLSDGDRNKIDNEIFLCDACGWWCEISEMGEEHCEDCEDKK